MRIEHDLTEDLTVIVRENQISIYDSSKPAMVILTMEEWDKLMEFINDRKNKMD